MTVGINFLTPFQFKFDKNIRRTQGLVIALWPLTKHVLVVLCHVWDIVAAVKNPPKKNFPTPNFSHGLNKITSRAWYLIWNTCQNRKDDKENVCSWTFSLLFNSPMNLKTTEIYPGTSGGSQPSAVGATGLSYLTLYSIWLVSKNSSYNIRMPLHRCTTELRSISRI